jgi:hypothetical protein
MSQAFHHAERPLKLLNEIDCVTRKGGVVILMGKNFIGKYSQIKEVIKILIKHGRFSTDFYGNFPADEITGGRY